MNSRLKNLARAIADWRCDPDRTISPPDMPMLGLATDEPELYAQYARLSPPERQYVVEYARRAAMLATDISVLGPLEVADGVWVDEASTLTGECWERINRSQQFWPTVSVAGDIVDLQKMYNDHAVDALRYAAEYQRQAPAPRPKLVPGVWLRILLIACACSAVWATIWWIATGERVGP